MNEKERKAAAALYRQQMDAYRRLRTTAEDEVEQAGRHIDNWQVIRRDAQRLLERANEKIADLEELAAKDGVEL